MAADVSNRDTGIFGVFGGDFGQFNAAFLGQCWNGNPDQLPVRGWVQAERGIHNGFFNRLHKALVPDLDGQHPRFRHADGTDLIHWHFRAVSLDH